MTEAPDNKKRCPNKPNWIEKGTFIVLGLTLIAVVWYACEAHHSNILTRRSIDTNTRPYIKIKLQEEGFVSTERLPAASPNFLVENVGKLPIVVSLEGSTDWFNDRHSRNPFNYKPISKRFIFPSSDPQQFAIPSGIGMTAGERQDLQDMGGQYVIYLAATYGPYVVRLCTSYKISFNGKLFNLSSPTLCPESDSNYAN
jgi:hypothetical protein